MQSERFAEIVDAYGADPRRWPIAEREAALAFSRADPSAAARLSEASAFDALLDSDLSAVPTPQLRQRVLAAAPPPRPRGSALLRRWWLSGAGLAAAGVAGLALGATLRPAEPSVDTLLAEAEVYDVTPLLAEPGEGLL